MAGCMQWFQVTCPTCTAQLQVRLPEGITSVQCSQCKAVFAVQIQPTALDSTQPPGSKRSRKRKAGGDKDPNAVPRALSAYNVFMKQEVAKVKAQHVEMAHRDAFKMVRPHAPSVCRLGRRRPPPLPPPAGAGSGWLWPALRTLGAAVPLSSPVLPLSAAAAADSEPRLFSGGGAMAGLSDEPAERRRALPTG